jgi:hypothetical protein
MKTLSQLIADRGIDESHAIELMRQRARYALTRDRTKVYASTPLGGIPWVRNIHETSADLMTLKLASDPVHEIDTRDYVAAWCRLNHLLES